MRRRRPPVPDEVREKHEEELHRLFYEYEGEMEIHQFSKYHFRLTYKGDKIDVWPIRKKYYAYWFNKSRSYKDTEEILQAFKDRPKTK